MHHISIVLDSFGIEISTQMEFMTPCMYSAPIQEYSFIIILNHKEPQSDDNRHELSPLVGILPLIPSEISQSLMSIFHSRCTLKKGWAHYEPNTNLNVSTHCPSVPSLPLHGSLSVSIIHQSAIIDN